MPSAMSAAASSIDAPPAIACSAASPGAASPPMFVSPIDAARWSRSTARRCAATATVAQSWARRVIFTYDQPAEPELRHADLHEHLAGRERGLEDAGEELAAGIVRSPPGPRTTSSRVEREDHRRQVGRRIAVCERPSDRPAVPDLRIADLTGRERHDRAVLLEERTRRDVLVPRQRADRDRGRRPRGRRTARRCGRCRRGARAARYGASSRGAASDHLRAASRPLARRAARSRARALGDLVVEPRRESRPHLLDRASRLARAWPAAGRRSRRGATARRRRR